MKILQIGYPKSGNYWVYRIIQESLDAAGVIQKNFIRQQPIYPIARQWALSYPEQVDINMMDILYPGCFFRISSIFRKRIENIEEYINSNTHIWSHSDYCKTSERIFPLLDNIVYIIRDPRDVILSKADFAFTPYMQTHYPTWHRSRSEYIEAESERIARQWKNHVRSYLNAAPSHDILILFYERLQQQFGQELSNLLDYLGFSFSPDQRDRIARKASARHMQKQSPQHVRKSRHYKWKDNLTAPGTAQINTITRDLLTRLKYPIEHTEEQLPEWK